GECRSFVLSNAQRSPRSPTRLQSKVVSYMKSISFRAAICVDQIRPTRLWVCFDLFDSRICRAHRRKDDLRALKAVPTSYFRHRPFQPAPRPLFFTTAFSFLSHLSSSGSDETSGSPLTTDSISACA